MGRDAAKVADMCCAGSFFWETSCATRSTGANSGCTGRPGDQKRPVGPWGSELTSDLDSSHWQGGGCARERMTCRHTRLLTKRMEKQ